LILGRDIQPSQIAISDKVVALIREDTVYGVLYSTLGKKSKTFFRELFPLL